jgi:cupin fold WbuC family metalloprotein
MKIVDRQTIASLLRRAASAPRKRMNLNLHPEPSDPTNRFINAGFAGTYVRPHRHRIDRWELVTAIEGRCDLVLFTPDGVVKQRFTLDRDNASLGEIPGGEWHSVVFHAPAAVVLEIKPGPYEPHLDKEFAAWAPAEDDEASTSYVAWLERAAPGDAWPD